MLFEKSVNHFIEKKTKKKLGVRHLFSNGKLLLFLQLHPKELLLGVNKRSLRAETIEPMFLIQL